MRKSLLSLVVVSGLLGTVVLPQFTFALTSSQKIEQELNELEKQQSAARKNADQVQAEIGRLQQEKKQTSNDLNTIVGQIETVNLKLNQLNDEIATIKNTLREIGIQLEEAQERIETRDALLKSRLRLMYMNGAVSYADVLLSSTSFSDFLDRLDALKSIVKQDKEILEANQRDRQAIADKEAEKKQQFAQLEGLYAQTAAVRADLQTKEKEKEVRIASLSEEERQKREQAEDISEAQEQLLLQHARKEAALAAARRAEAAARAAAASKSKSGGKSSPTSSYNAFSGGRMAYPLEKNAPMTSDYGTRADPFTGKRTSHKGIDFGAPSGTGILAAADGEVIVAAWWSGYGNCVIIDHGNGVWTLYGHIRNGGIHVSKGDTVKRGQKIAEVGTTGQSTGNHLHFEVRINERPVDPKPYLR
ncbi:murein hydrolase activator EnvC family protein [Paenibacillus xerothermodurans]|uniref:Peptidase M23 n=1 Tax=Paenibacillus xerothermodurans TaxID=1977292 RepID=A0A2W1N4I4_PAEXE|nr:M23 family metallopeptidase [Paenibacillus xerothermodurans]PZE19267.1 peptidase M23 [Paenibacillus xerothermodurans]